MSTEFDLALQRAFQIVNDAAKQGADIMMAAQLAEIQALQVPTVRYIPPEVREDDSDERGAIE